MLNNLSIIFKVFISILYVVALIAIGHCDFGILETLVACMITFCVYITIMQSIGKAFDNE